MSDTFAARSPDIREVETLFRSWLTGHNFWPLTYPCFTGLSLRVTGAKRHRAGGAL